MSKSKNDYLDIIYNEQARPLTKYPYKLSNFLIKKYNLEKGSKILDVGCGRGEFLKGFISNGLVGYGTDQSEYLKKFFKNIKFKKSDLEREGIPYPDNFFDCIFSKSVIEHFYNPEILGKEILRVLKPGGLAIIMCPSWEYNYKMFYEDYTHRTPFTKISLNDFLLINGFTNVKSEYFRQLPLLWKSNHLKIFAEITRICLPSKFKKFSKWIRFSKEIMLLGCGYKPEI
tara:strand:- start:384 stop:1070 length:687 start_codon:yes stop_codon:yes gene_type:complete